MKRYVENIRVSLGAVLVSLIVWYLLFKENLPQSGAILTDGSGDGYKNFFTFGYQYLYGQGLHFGGMLHPYGDLAIYADAQPLIVWLLQFFKWLGISSGNYLLAVFNFLPVAALGLCFVFLYKIFRHYKIPAVYALGFSFVCICLSPQLYRYQSHNSLSYSFIIPFYWWAMIVTRDRIKVVFTVFLTLFTVFLGFIHPYYIPILSIFGSSSLLARLVFFRKMNWNWLLLAIAPPLIFYLMLNGIEVAQDRPVNPYGMQVYTTSAYDLLPFYGMLSQVMDVVTKTRLHWNEGYCYPGFLFFVAPIGWIIAKGHTILKSGKIIPHLAKPGDLGVFLISSIVVLCFASGLHLIWGDFILDLMPPLRQFRSLGRFSWVFYYVFFVWSCHWFYLFLQNREKRNLVIPFTIVAGTLWGYEIVAYTNTIYSNISEYKSENSFVRNRQIAEMLEVTQISSSRFQAVLTLPGSTIGSEKLYVNEDWWIKKYAYPFAFQEGIPLTSCNLSRVPLSRIVKIVQMGSSGYVDKLIRFDLTDNRPYLVIIPNQYLPLYKDLTGGFAFINSDENVSIFEMPLDQLEIQRKVARTDILDAVSLSSFVHGEAVRVHDSSFVYFHEFEEDAAEWGLASVGALFIPSGNRTYTLFDHEIIKDAQMELSLWYLLQSDKSNVPHFELKMYKDVELIASEVFRDWDFKRFEVIDFWIRIRKDFTIPKGANRVELEVHGVHLILDKLLVKSPETNVFQRNEVTEAIFFNHKLAVLPED